ncbi:ABC transporter substrate-binding protein [Candidatus Poribacteria bacterium]|nr:ABC transporter substrate-binding protein [Candidatus Poribacteria bacterium]
MRYYLRNVVVTVLIVILLTAASGCGQPKTGGTESAAKPPSSPERPARIVSMAPSITEVLFALGLGPRVVGVSDFCNYPPEALTKKKIGGIVNPSIETMIAMNPDLVIGLPSPAQESLHHSLRVLGIRVFTFPNDTIADMYNMIQTIGKETSTEKAADELVGRLKAKFSEVSGEVASQPRRKVMFVVGVDPLFVAGRGTFIDELIGMAGGKNIATDSISKYPQLGIEEVVARAPEVILFTALNLNPTPEQDAEARKLWEKYPSIPAVKEGRIYGLNADHVTRPGPRSGLGAEEIARAIHPEVYDGGEQTR